MKHLWRIVWILLLWCGCEGLARYRYDLQNIWLPMALRDNLAPSALKSHRLVPHYAGTSHSGIDFYTDKWGFRCSKSEYLASVNSNRSADQSSSGLILAGDSIAFGMYQNFEASLGFHLGQSLPQFKIFVQALPGGSQAMSLDHLFGPDQLAVNCKAQWLVHSITHYDNTDNWLYALDQLEGQKLENKILRTIKYYGGPYTIQMLQLKLRDFLRKDQRKDLLWADDAPPMRTGASERAIKALGEACKKNQLHLALFFVPDKGELLSREVHPPTILLKLCADLDIPFFDLAQALQKDPEVDLNLVFRDDNIHLSPYGAKVGGKKLAQWFAELRP
jgi:hypothetical protein